MIGNVIKTISTSGQAVIYRGEIYSMPLKHFKIVLYNLRSEGLRLPVRQVCLRIAWMYRYWGMG